MPLEMKVLLEKKKWIIKEYYQYAAFIFRKHDVCFQQCAVIGSVLINLSYYI